MQFPDISRLWREFDPSVRWLVVVRMVGALGFALSLPFLTIYLHEELLIPMTHIGLMLTISGILGAMASTIGGTVSDRMGRRRMLVPLAAGRMLVFLTLAGLVYWRRPFYTFAAVFILNGILGTATFPVMDAVIADAVPSDRRSEAYGLMRVAANFGWAFGPAIGGIIILSGYHWLFIATAAALGGMLAVIVFKLPETAPTASRPTFRVGAFLDDRHLVRFLIVLLALFLVKGQLVATLSVHASSNVGLSKFQIGLLYFLNAGLVTLFQVPMTRLIKPVPALSALVMSAALYGAGYLGVGYAAGLLGMMSAMVVITAAETIEGPTGSSYVSVLAPSDRVGVYMGGYNLVMHLGWTIGPLIGGVMLDNFSQPRTAWEMVAALAVLSGLGFLIMGRRKRENEPRPVT